MSLCREALASRSGKSMLERRRIKAYTLSGKWVCLPGLGSGEDFGTFPLNWFVRDLTSTPGWVEILRHPDAIERVKEGVHWQRLDTSSWMPVTVLFCHPGNTSTIGVAGDKLSFYDATHLQVLNTVAQIPFEDVGDGLSSVSMPSTPNPSSAEIPVEDVADPEHDTGSSAAMVREERWRANDGELYTRDEFLEWYGESFADRAWYGESFADQRRVAPDGHYYTFREFEHWYGPHAAKKWHAAGDDTHLAGDGF